MKKPNLFIAGQSKSGTSALYFTLRQHPDVFMSPVKEPCYFCRDLIEDSDRYYGRKRFFDHRDPEDYYALYNGAGNEKVLGESTTLYAYSENAAEHIAKEVPGAKAIIILREPVSFMSSVHNEMYRKAQENVADFEAAVRLEEERKAGRQLPPNCLAPSLHFYTDRARYAEQIQRFYDALGEENVKVLIYEDFRKNNDEVFRSMLDFIGVDNTFVPEVETRNVSGMPRSGRLNQLIMSSSLKRGLQKLLPHGAYEMLKPIGRSLLWKKEKPKEPSEAFKSEMRERLAPEVEKLSKLLGQNLSEKWGY